MPNTKILKSKKASEADLALSVSKVKTFDSCKAKYKYSYIEKLPRKEWSFHVFGKYLHDILEEFHKYLKENPDIEIKSLMNDCVEQSKLKYNLSLDQIKEAQDIINEYLQQLTRQKKENKEPEIIAVEKPFFIDIDGKILLNGYIDRVQRDIDGVLHVADYKTTKDKKYLSGDWFQLLTYSFALMLEDSDIDKIRASYILLRHGFSFMTQEYTRDEVMSISDKFLDYANDIEEEKLWRPSPQFLCKYCDFIDHCGEGKNYLIKRGIIEQPGYGLVSW